MIEGGAYIAEGNGDLVGRTPVHEVEVEVGLEVRGIEDAVGGLGDVAGRLGSLGASLVGGVEHLSGILESLHGGGGLLLECKNLARLLALKIALHGALELNLGGAAHALLKVFILILGEVEVAGLKVHRIAVSNEAINL
jgi:hypothetical protein